MGRIIISAAFGMSLTTVGTAAVTAKQVGHSAFDQLDMTSSGIIAPSAFVAADPLRGKYATN